MAKKPDEQPLPKTQLLWRLPSAAADGAAGRVAAAGAREQLPTTEPMSVDALHAIESTAEDRDALPAAPTQILEPSIHDARTELLASPPPRAPAPAAQDAPAAPPALPAPQVPEHATAPAAAATMPPLPHSGRRLLWLIVAGCALSGAAVGALLGPRWRALATASPETTGAGQPLGAAGGTARLLDTAVSEQGRVLQLRFAVPRSAAAGAAGALRVQLLQGGQAVEPRFSSDETPPRSEQQLLRFVFRPPHPVARAVTLRITPVGAAPLRARVALPRSR